MNCELLSMKKIDCPACPVNEIMNEQTSSNCMGTVMHHVAIAWALHELGRNVKLLYVARAQL